MTLAVPLLLCSLLDGLRLDIANLLSRQSLYLVMGGGGLAAGVHPFDRGRETWTGVPTDTPGGAAGVLIRVAR